MFKKIARKLGQALNSNSPVSATNNSVTSTVRINESSFSVDEDSIDESSSGEEDYLDQIDYKDEKTKETLLSIRKVLKEANNFKKKGVYSNCSEEDKYAIKKLIKLLEEKAKTLEESGKDEPNEIEQLLKKADKNLKDLKKITEQPKYQTLGLFPSLITTSSTASVRLSKPPARRHHFFGDKKAPIEERTDVLKNQKTRSSVNSNKHCSLGYSSGASAKKKKKRHRVNSETPNNKRNKRNRF